jgi:hypothetical protein
MSRVAILLAGASFGSVISLLVGSCTERESTSACYFDDTEDASKYLSPISWRDWCDYTGDEVSPLVAEYCPSGECVDTFTTCDEVPLNEPCRTCPAEELDQMVLVALGAEYERRCPGQPQEIIDFERGCVFERPLIPASPENKQCCYTAVVVGECSLMGT